MKSVLTLVLSLFISLSAQAQLTLHYYPSHPAKDGSIPQACLDEGQVLRIEMSKFPTPATWTVYIACDDAAWMEIINRIHPGYSGAFVYGDTDPVGNLIFFRGTTLLGLTKATTPEHLVAHELAHIALKSYDEQKVDRQAQQWLNKLTATR